MLKVAKLLIVEVTKILICSCSKDIIKLLTNEVVTVKFVIILRDDIRVEYNIL